MQESKAKHTKSSSMWGKYSRHLEQEEPAGTENVHDYQINVSGGRGALAGTTRVISIVGRPKAKRQAPQREGQEQC
jgi:hypothetical protein